ncbi:hypothetical protein PYW08_000341 [Mythimna loreyi]|uniref:Uncharacterized protein n=1 Tax=Mythimna loreyi TaxID=667449 RepID=A0ACC2RC66_9NEOP|nr:hypothetical protein PYW08_000341 [Mythimna loreyi]
MVTEWLKTLDYEDAENMIVYITSLHFCKMSSRHFRKRDKQNNLPPPPDDSDDDYQPLYVKTTGLSKYAGLEVSSSSHSEHGSERSEEEVQDNPSVQPKSTGAKKKTFKKKGKGKARVSDDGLDEVERSVKEVNDILGSPPPAEPVPEKPYNQALEVLTIDPKHLNVANEIRKLFGPDEAQTKRGRTQNRALLLKRVLIHPDTKTPVYEFNNYGLSMMKYKDKENRMYFVFNHSEAYQKMHRNFLRRLAFAQRSGDILRYFDEARQKMHIEALLEISDRLFRLEENGVANEIVENVVTFLQYVAHPLFILSQNNVRLDYKFMENRPFHVAMLKYVYLLTNRACHRTALEIAKMLLLIDPNDPLAILSIIDVLALRAREHEWLIDTIKYFDRQREACLLFNIMYSNSLAHYHVAQKNKLDLAEADRLIRDAILAFPNVFMKILEFSHVTKEELTKHEIFKPDPQPRSSGALEPFLIYAMMTFPRWNEPEVMKWLLRNATELCAAYDTDAKIRDSAKCWNISRYSLYKVWPKEYLRHISILSSMSKLIIDTPLFFNRATCAWDPLLDKSVNRYSYSYEYEPNRSASTPGFPAAGAAGGAAADAESPVHSNRMRNAYYRMITEVAAQTGCYPFMYLTDEEARELNAAQLVDTPFVGPQVLENRDLVFLPPEMNETEPRRTHPNGTLFSLQEQPTFVPGFNITIADWNVEFMYPDWGKINSKLFQKNQPMPCRDWAFDDNDEEFDDYDYADDEENFARDDRDMARALATKGPGPDDEQEDEEEGLPTNAN